MATRPQHFLAGPSETRPAGPWVRQEELEGEGVREAKEEGAREGGQDGAKMERETRKKTKERGLERQRGRGAPASSRRPDQRTPEREERSSVYTIRPGAAGVFSLHTPRAARAPADSRTKRSSAGVLSCRAPPNGACISA